MKEEQYTVIMYRISKHVNYFLQNISLKSG